MIVLAIEYPCATCGYALRRPVLLKLDTLPAKLNGLIVPPLPDGWTLDREGGVHCPAHPETLVKPVGVVPNLTAINGRKQ